jgi:hypothetical protein
MRRLALEAGDRIMKVYTAASFEVKAKSDTSPVTEADEAAEIDAETAEFELKAAYSEDERMKLAEDGMALPDGSFPIKNGDDLKNAIQAYGRAKDKEAAKAHIMKRAEDLDMEDLIPDSWMDEDEAMDDADEKAAEDPEFLSALMEFEMLALETESDDTL